MKSLFFLCALLLASVVCAEDKQKEDKSNVLIIMKDNVIKVTNNAINLVTEQVSTVQQTTEYYIQKLKEEAKRVREHVQEQTHQAHNKIKAKIDQAIKEAAHLEVTECANMAEAFDQTRNEVRSEASNCVQKVLNSAHNYMQQMKDSYTNVLRNLTDIKDNAQACVEDIGSFSATAAAFICVNKVTIEGTVAATKNVPALLLDLGKFSLRIATLLPEISICSTVKSVKEINQDSDELVKKVKECIAAVRKQNKEKL